MVDLAAATALLGITPTQMAAPVSTDGDDDGVKLTKLDGCSYIGDPSLGYDVNKFEGGMPVTQYLAGARAELGARPGVTPMEVTLGDAAVGFTSAVGSKTMARIEVAKGSTLVSVSSVATDAAKAKAIAVEGATRLVAAIG